MKSVPPHRVESAVRSDQCTTFWYDNPDISDLLFATFNEPQFSKKSICSLAYNRKIGKGLHNFRNRENVWEGELTDSLGDKVVYHPILTVSTLSRDIIYQELDGILTGIDGINCEARALLILIPVLMHYDHFGVIAIAPIPMHRENGDIRANVFFFNPFGDQSSYRNEENIMCEYLGSRYNTEVRRNPIRYQMDWSQCGPFVIQFVENASKLALEGTDFTNISFNAFGMETLGNEYNGSEVISLRKSHAERLRGKATNYSLYVLNHVQSILENMDTKTIKHSFRVNYLMGEIKAVSRQKLYLARDSRIIQSRAWPEGGEGLIRKINNVDVFEIQLGTLFSLLKRDAQVILTIESGSKYFSQCYEVKNLKIPGTLEDRSECFHEEKDSFNGKTVIAMCDIHALPACLIDYTKLGSNIAGFILRYGGIGIVGSITNMPLASLVGAIAASGYIAYNLYLYDIQGGDKNLNTFPILLLSGSIMATVAGVPLLSGIGGAYTLALIVLAIEESDKYSSMLEAHRLLEMEL